MAQCEQRYTPLAVYIPACIERLTITTGLTGDFIVEIYDRFSNVYEVTGATTGDIEIDFTDTDIFPDGFINEFSGQIGILIYISDNIFEWTCSNKTFNSVIIKPQRFTPTKTEYAVDLTDCEFVGEFDASFNFDFNV